MGGGRGQLIAPEDRAQAIKLVKEACAQGARKRAACNVLNIHLRSLERWEKAGGLQDKRTTSIRPTQKKQLSLEEKKMIITICNQPEYRDLPPSKIVPRLADKGIYMASESSFYRVLREEKQLAHRRLSRPVKHHKPKACQAQKANQVWSWDISYLPSTVQGLYFYLYCVIDVYSRKITAWSIHENESAEWASVFIQQACLDEGVEKDQLVLHSDNGKPMKGATMRVMLEKLGVMPSFSRPSVSDDNPFSESLFRTVKYHSTFPYINKFNTILEARQWMENFVDWYNTQHLHSGLKFVTPEQRHLGLDKAILEQRHQLYQVAKQKNPLRWSGQTRNWVLPKVITLNPDRKSRHLIANDNTPLVMNA